MLLEKIIIITNRQATNWTNLISYIGVFKKWNTMKKLSELNEI